MTKAYIVQSILSKSTQQKSDVEAIINTLMEVIKTSMEEGDNIYLRGFGTFYIKRRAKKTARNIKANTSMEIPAHNIPAFRPATEFAASVKGKK